MYELHQVSENCYYIQSPAKVGLVKLNETQVCLIDSGSDKEAGRKIRQILERSNWELTAIYNTHSNADHIGGNQYLQKQTGCRIFAPEIECAFTQYPILEPAFLYGGYPPKELRHKFLLAQESKASLLTADALPECMELLPLPGHFFHMTGYRTSDHMIYLADCLSNRETLEKYQISFLYDVASYLSTLDMVKQLEADLFIPAHAEPVKDIRPLAQLNIDKVHEIAEAIIDICREPLPFERILQQLFRKYGLVMNFEQYVLIGSTLRSYLAWLKDSGRVEVLFEDGQMLWQS